MPISLVPSHPQDPRQALEQFATHAAGYSVNLNGCLSWNQVHLLRGGAAVVRWGTIDRGKLVEKVGTTNGRFWDGKYGNGVAIKTPRAGPPDSESNIKKFLKEVHVWSKMDHANILPLLGIITEIDWTVSIISPWMKNGNAHNYVKNKAVDPRPLIEGIAKGLHYLHNHAQNPIFHGDMKGVNVLISDNGEALLTDFGYSVAVDSSFSMSMSSQGGGKGTLRWMAPEILDGSDASAEADVWSFGMTALELFTREKPYPELCKGVAVTASIARGRKPNFPSAKDTCKRMTDEWWDICSRCWEYDPASRLTMLCIVERITEIKNMSRAFVPNGIV